MAENEILDVGNPRRYRRWRQALADCNVGEREVADTLQQEFSQVLRNRLRTKPIYLVLKACASSQEMLQEAILSLKDRALAKVVERAHSITHSTDPAIVGPKIAELLIDGLADRSTRFCLRQARNGDPSRYLRIETETRARLEASRGEIAHILEAALRNEPIRRVVPRRQKVTPEALLTTSLLEGVR